MSNLPDALPKNKNQVQSLSNCTLIYFSISLSSLSLIKKNIHLSLISLSISLCLCFSLIVPLALSLSLCLFLSLCLGLSLFFSLVPYLNQCEVFSFSFSLFFHSFSFFFLVFSFSPSLSRSIPFLVCQKSSQNFYKVLGKTIYVLYAFILFYSFLFYCIQGCMLCKLLWSGGMAAWGKN